MDIKDNIVSGISFIGETVSEIASSVAEKNRLRIQLNHIKSVIKNDSATRDQAYIELGRFFYENLREDASPENEAICAVIDSASDRISAASIKYMELLNLQNETKIGAENTEKLKKIISEKASAAAKAAMEKGAELGQKAKDLSAQGVQLAKDTAVKAKAAADDLKEKAVDAAEDLKDKAAEAAEDVKERLSPERKGELEQLIAEEQQKLQETQAEETPAAPAKTPENEESPDSFDF